MRSLSVVVIAVFLLLSVRPARCYAAWHGKKHARIWHDGTYKMNGRVKTAKSYRYANDTITDVIIDTHDTNGYPVFLKHERKGELVEQKTISYDFKKNSVRTVSTYTNATRTELIHYRRRKIVCSSSLDTNNKLINYTRYKYNRHGNEIARNTYGPDGSLLCHCDYFYDNNQKLDISKLKFDCSDVDGNWPDIVIGAGRRTKKTEFDNELNYRYRTEYTRNDSGKIIEAKQYDAEGLLVCDFKYSKFDDHGNWREKEISPGHFIRLEISYY